MSSFQDFQRERERERERKSLPQGFYERKTPKS